MWWQVSFVHLSVCQSFHYLHFSSSHPKEVFKGLVKGEAIWFLRSNSTPENYKRTISTSRYHLLCRRYPKGFVDSLLPTVPYSLRNNYIQPLPTLNLNLSSSLNITPNPITPDSSLLTGSALLPRHSMLKLASLPLVSGASLRLAQPSVIS